MFHSQLARNGSLEGLVYGCLHLIQRPIKMILDLSYRSEETHRASYHHASYPLIKALDDRITSIESCLCSQ